jgi:hypothetical protein
MMDVTTGLQKSEPPVEVRKREIPMGDGSRILTLLDVHGGLILLEAMGAAVLFPKLPALHIAIARDQVSHDPTNTWAPGSIGMAPCRFRHDGIHQLDLMWCELGLLSPACFQPRRRQLVRMNRFTNFIAEVLANFRVGPPVGEPICDIASGPLQ